MVEQQREVGGRGDLARGLARPIRQRSQTQQTRFELAEAQISRTLVEATLEYFGDKPGGPNKVINRCGMPSTLLIG